MSGDQQHDPQALPRSTEHDSSSTVKTKGAKKADRDEANRRKAQEQADRLDPLLAQIRNAPFGKFEDELKAALRSLESQKNKRADISYVLERAFLLVPEGSSGVIVAKHFKSEKKWVARDLNEAIRGLTNAASQAEARRASFGKIIHGALITFISAAIELEKESKGTPSSSKKGVGLQFDETIKLLAELHRALPQSAELKFVGLDETPVARVLGEARSLFVRYPAVEGVREMFGQNLFGFDFQIQLPTTTSVENPVAAAEEADASIVASASKSVQEKVPETRPVAVDEPLANSTAAVTASETAIPKKMDVVPAEVAPLHGSKPFENPLEKPIQKPELKPTEKSRKPSPDQDPNGLHAKQLRELKTKFDATERALESSEKARERLRSDLSTAQQELASLRHQLRDAYVLREELSSSVQRLQAKVDELAQIEKELAVERLRVAELDRVRQELMEQTRGLESAVSLAKESEFERGRAAMRATIARHCLESLGQIADEAVGIPGSSGQFIKDMADSLSRYLKVEE